MESSLKIQMDVKNNAQELKNYMLDMSNWEEEMKKKELALHNEKPQQSLIPPPRNKIKRSKSDNEKNHSNKPKKISAYDYSAWDKFDVEKACAEVDEESSDIAENQKQIHVKSMTNCEKETKHDLSKNNENLSFIDEAFYEKQLGNQFVKKERWVDAIKCYTNAISLDSSNAIFYANRSLCFLKLKNFKSAETDATTAIQLDQNYVKAYQRRAMARVALKQLTEAKSDYQKILSIEPKNSLAREEINKIDEKLKKEEGISKSNKKETFDYKNIFKSEETKFENTTEVKKKSTTLKNIYSIKSQASITKEARTTDEIDNTECQETLHNTNKNFNSESEPHFFEKGDCNKRIVAMSNNITSEAFKPLPEWCEIVHPIKLPPHRRSKKLLRRINITVKDEVIDFAKDAKTVHKIQREALEEQKVSFKPVSGDEFKSERLSFEIPKTAIQFQKCWKVIRKSPEECYSYLKKIPGKELVHIFENSLESGLFSELITFLASDDVKKDSEFVSDFLFGLSRVKRFGSLILFMSEADRTCLKNSIGELSKEQSSELLKLYELKI